MINGI
ncbi:hypothetical protein R3I94_011826 [Phoxinus phoxinus]